MVIITLISACSIIYWQLTSETDQLIYNCHILIYYIIIVKITKMIKNNENFTILHVKLF